MTAACNTSSNRSCSRGAQKAESVRRAIDVVRSTLKNFVDNGPTEAELSDAKTYLTGSFPLSFSSNVGITNELNGFQELGLPIDYAKKRNALIDAVTITDVKRAAKRIFDPRAMTIVVAGNPAAAPSRRSSASGGARRSNH
jgi:zinc protease